MSEVQTPATQAPRSHARPPAPPIDRATDYARRVLDGELIAGPHVRAACTRHLRDLEEGLGRGLTWSVDHAARAIAFFEEVLYLNGGQFEGQPFILQPWQAFVIGSLFGWLKGDVRRFRVAYVETAKGSGKSPLAAGIGMYGLTADGEARAEIYAAATKKDQAMVLFRDAVAMFTQSPELSARLSPSGMGERIWNLAYHATGSFFRPIAADEGQSGPRPHIGLVDEVHEHKTMDVVEMLRAGTKSRRQALMFLITNSGAGETTPCGRYHAYAIEIATAARQDDTFFAYVCAVDEGDDPLLDESCWPKSNPSLQLANLPGMDYLRDQVREARGMPAKESIVRRLCFCQWTGAISPWLSATIWEPCRRDFRLEDLRGRRAWAGLDLSSTTDLTSLVLAVEPEDESEPVALLSFCWLPEDGLRDRADRDRVPYDVWHRQGFLETTPGKAISRRHVLMRMAQIFSQFDMQGLAYDRWRIEDLKQLAADDGVPLPEMLAFGQGYKDMGPALDVFEAGLLNHTLAHNGHPVFTWCASNAVTDIDPAGNRKLNKVKATGRIDIVVAAVMAEACRVRATETIPEITQGLVAL